VKAKAARNPKDLRIEHVGPMRELTIKAIELVTKHKSDGPLLRFIKKRYGIVILTGEETIQLNRQNRSKIDP
jgi:hypothetical protein